MYLFYTSGDTILRHQKQSIRHTVILLSFLLISGCATTTGDYTTKSVPATARTQTFRGSFDTVFKGVMKVMSKEGFGVAEANEEVGLIRTRFRQSNEGNFRTRYSITLTRVDSDRTRIRMTITTQEKSLGSWSVVSLTEAQAREFYENGFEEIREELGQ